MNQVFIILVTREEGAIVFHNRIRPLHGKAFQLAGGPAIPGVSDQDQARFYFNEQICPRNYIPVDLLSELEAVFVDSFSLRVSNFSQVVHKYFVYYTNTNFTRILSIPGYDRGIDSNRFDGSNSVKLQSGSLVYMHSSRRLWGDGVIAGNRADIFGYRPIRRALEIVHFRYP